MQVEGIPSYAPCFIHLGELGRPKKLFDLGRAEMIFSETFDVSMIVPRSIDSRLYGIYSSRVYVGHYTEYQCHHPIDYLFFLRLILLYDTKPSQIATVIGLTWRNKLINWIFKFRDFRQNVNNLNYPSFQFDRHVLRTYATTVYTRSRAYIDNLCRSSRARPRVLLSNAGAASFIPRDISTT